MIPATSSATNPLSVFLNNARPVGNVPVPLQSTAFDIAIEAGLAIVSTTRLFRNNETSSIEATLTFPVPVHAVLFSLDVRIGVRSVQATAKAKDAARSTYEEGLDGGKTAVLHEELLRGIHMLSVGNIPAGEEIEVKTIWVMPLMMAGGEGHLRIPTTVGQIYGQSPLADGDDFTWGTDVPMADVTVRSGGVTVMIGGRNIGTEPIKVPMNQPIDLSVGKWQSERLTSHFASGEGLELELCPAPASSSALSLAILVDHSSSMDETVHTGETGQQTVHDLVVSALNAISAQLANEDFIDLWEFSDRARHVGHSLGNQPTLPSLIGKLSPPSGGTDIDQSLSVVLKATEANSLLLITDGRSHALDVQALAGQGKRISVLLVGEDSLEAQVGHLAALTGGDIFVAPKNAVDKILGAAMNSLRLSTQKATKTGVATENQADFSLSGMTIKLKRTGKVDTRSRSTLEHGVAAFAASLRLPLLSAEDAASLAAAEGMVTHLTSLVLVDEASSVQNSVPLRRRVPLAPMQASVSYASRHRVYRMASPITPPLENANKHQSIISRVLGYLYRTANSSVTTEASEDTLSVRLDALAPLIDWDEFAQELSHGWIDGLEDDIADGIRQMAHSPELLMLANEQRVDALRVVIFLLAQRASTQKSRSATRVMLRLRSDLNPGTISAIERLDRKYMS